jgi:ribose 5-phosphate isomerase B
MKIAIGNDHAGTDYKFKIVSHLKSKNIEVINHGTDANESVDYPDFVHPVAKDVERKEADFGILLCGSANGVAMTANKYKNIRAGLCWNNEIVSLIKQHNNANILCIPARYTTEEEIITMVDTFINTDFQGGRHQRRVDKISSCY